MYHGQEVMFVTYGRGVGRAILIVIHRPDREGAIMSKLDLLVQDFLAQKKIAVVGVSDNRETGCNEAYRHFRDAGYVVYAVNPRLATFEGAPCYPDLASIPETPDAVFILANPKVTEKVVAECVALGVRRVWMHCILGTKPGLAAGITSVSPEAVRLCRENGIAVIPGSCPNQFLRADIGHKVMRVFCRAMGWQRVSEIGAEAELPVAH
jgi:predicted CoA-binding protein